MKTSTALMLAVLLGALCLGQAPAQTQSQPGGPARSADSVRDPAQETRLKQLSEELRCLVCQNQSLADSNAELAVDLRNQVRDQIEQGKSDQEIKSYLVQRYGDFVLYKPPVQSNTTLLWFGPFALLAVGLSVWWLMSRRPARGPASANGAAGSGPAGTVASNPGTAGRPGDSPDLAAARRLLDEEP
ncbi:MAG TPA: cytochrome c-type biogenesis protein CcmH [Burkholderiaceae bacterium]|nr:cytochrome c-type biogenesis protein CcmH [Burkholderiaceae bacterium]